MSKEIQDQIINILIEKGITFKAQYMGEKKNSLGGNTTMDWWNISLSGDGKQEDFDYFTGLGHRKWDKPFSAKQVLPQGTKDYKYTYQELGNPKSVHYSQMAKANLKPCSPHVADVLYSLVMDSEALDCSFPEWCDNLGYGEDSRKALDTYLLCQKIGKQLQNIFDRDTLTKVKTLLQDY